MSPIKNIVFDVGKVLVDFSYDDLFRFLREKGAKFKDVEDFVSQVDLLAYEHGLISDDAFIDKVQKMLSHKADRGALIRQWVEIFKPIHEMLDLARHLQARFGVYLLSNTSALHWAYLIEEYQLAKIGMDMIASFEVGAMKPSPKIFQAAEKRFGLKPESTLFIDDIQENAAGAMACGWQGIHHRGITETKGQMEALLGVSLP